MKIILFILLLLLKQNLIYSLKINDKYLLPRIIQQPQSQIAQTNSKIIFKCDYDTIDTLTLTSTLAISSFIQIKWLFNLQQIQQTDNDYLIEKNRLIIQKFNEYKHSGEYRCLINNTFISWSILSEAANLSLAFIDKTQQEKTNDVILNISEGNVAIISCKLPESNPPAIPLFVLNNTILIDNEIPRYKIFPSGNLQISNVKYTDSGVYTCSARNPITNEIRNYTKRTLLKVFEPKISEGPNIIYSPNDANRVQIGSNLTLECVANGAPVPVVTWEKYGGLLPDKRSTQLFGNLILTNIQQEDRGTYVCRADNGPGQTTFKTAMIDVFEAPTLLSLNDGTMNSISSQIVKYYANRNDNIELKCPIRAKPKADVQWFFNGKTLITNQKQYVITERSLLIKNVNQQLIGAYQCYAKNEYGFKQAQIVLYLKEDIQQLEQSSGELIIAQPTVVSSIITNLPESIIYGPKPTILIGPQNLTIYEGQTVVLLCVTEANAQINWLQNDIIIEPSLMNRRFEINQVGNLRIVSAQKSDTGVYKCIASNEFGMTTSEGFVTVKDDEASVVQRKLINDENNEYINKKVNQKKKQYPIASRPEIEQIDNDKILLKWIISNNLDDELIDYFKIEYKTGLNNKKHDWTVIDEKIDSMKREYILTDLSPHENYRFRLNCFYKNTHQIHSPQSIRFKLVESIIKSNSTTIADPLQIEIQILQVWALSDSSLALKWQLLKDDSQDNSSYRQSIEGFYIYYRKLSAQDVLNFDNLMPQNEVSIDNYQLIKIPNSQLHLVDTYIITNLDSISTYEIKMTCVGQNNKLICETSNVVYGQTLNKSNNNIAMDLGFFAVPQQKSDLIRITTPQSILTSNQHLNKQNEYLYPILGAILIILILAFGIFSLICIIKYREHKRLLIKLNTSQKLNSGSSCPTLIYDDCLRNLNQNNKLLVASTALSANNNNNNNNTLLNDNNTFLNLLNSVQTNSSTFNNTQTTLLSSNGNPPPPIPNVPPPQITSTLNRNNINLNVNPIGYLDANTINFIKQHQAQLHQQQQENFYHTLNFNNNTNNGQLMHQLNTNDYTNATLNLRAQILLKQNPIIIDAINSKNDVNENCTMTPKKRNKRGGGSTRSKKYEKVYQTQVLSEQEKLQLQFIQQLQQQQQQQLEQEQHNMLLLSSILNNVQQQQQQQQEDESHGYRSNKYLQYTINSNNKYSSSVNNNQNELLLQTANNQQVSSSSNSSSGIGSTTTANSGDSMNEELVPFLISSNNNNNQNSDHNIIKDHDYDFHKILQ